MNDNERLIVELAMMREIPIMIPDTKGETYYGWYDRRDSTSKCSNTTREGLIEQVAKRIAKTSDDDSFDPSTTKKRLSATEFIRELLDDDMAGDTPVESFLATAREWLKGKWVSASFDENPEMDTVMPVKPVVFTDAEAKYIMESAKKKENKELLPVLDFGVGKVDLNKRQFRGKITKENSGIDLALCNIEPSADKLVSRIKQIKAKPLKEQPKCIATLFHGIPGTGKTELAKYLANELQLEVLKKTFGEIQSKYIGEGEKNLHAAFQEAQEKNKVLLIDEIDSIGASRENADKAWEKTMVNQLLTELDEFKGVFIGTTNMLSSLDAAVLRRLHLKVEFKPLTEEQTALAFKHFFPKLRMPKAIENIKLLTPGDFNAVKHKALYEAEVAKPSRIIELLQEEVDTKIKASPTLSTLFNTREALDRGLY